MSVVRSWTLAVVALNQLLLPPAFAAQQLVTTKTLLVKNPPSGARKVLWKVKETAATVAGDPTADGATLHIQLTPGGDQCVTMPALGWSAISTIGFKYKDADLVNGPVKVAMVKKTPSGTFLVKALLKNGGPTSITVAPGDPTTSYAVNFTLGVGDDYCGGTATATPNPNDSVTFKVSNDGAPAVCISACNATTTSSSTTSTSSTTETSTSTSTTAPGPDLVVTSFSGPSSASAGGTVAVSVTVMNAGSATTGGSWTDAVRLSVDATYSTGDAVVGSAAHGSLSAGSSSTVAVVGIIPPGTPPGSYYLVGMADAAGFIPETNETNNTAATPITIF